MTIFNIQYDRSRSKLHQCQLMRSGLESKPGSWRPKYPCIVCSTVCKTGIITCDECNQWVYKERLGMSLTELSRLDRKEDSWSCPKCASINNSSRLFSVPEAKKDDTFSSAHTLDFSNQPSAIECISDISFPTSSSTSTDPDTDHSLLSSVDPVMSSSPKPKIQSKPQRKSIRILNINFQSLRKKGKLLEATIIDADPDIIIGTETWLDKSIAFCKILQNKFGYDIHRRDRPAEPNGGVLLAAKRCPLLSDVNCANEVELISGTVKIDIDNKKSLTITSYYRPPNRTYDAYLSAMDDKL